MSGFRPRFFVDQEGLFLGHVDSQTGGAEVTLGSADSHHALRVLRLQVGDRCEVVVGTTVYAASVGQAADPVRVVLDARLEGPAAGAVYRSQVGLVQVFTRPALLDEVLEKGTEVGASFFLLVPAAGASRLSESSTSRRLSRWRRIVLEAAKQSKQVVVPTVESADSLDRALDYLGASDTLSLLLEPSAPLTLAEKLIEKPQERELSGVQVALWVGPESGWSSVERERLAGAGVEPVRLGQSVLRTETAGPVAVAVARLAMGDW